MGDLGEGRGSARWEGGGEVVSGRVRDGEVGAGEVSGEGEGLREGGGMMGGEGRVPKIT